MTDTLPPEVLRALAYPFDPPRHGFVFVAGQGLRIVADGADPLGDALVELDGESIEVATALHRLGAPAGGTEKRTPVVGYGSNASPKRLSEKFGDGPDQVIPVLRCRLHGQDVVYATHIATYGSIPAGIYRSPGTVADVSVALLTDHQLEVMHESEGENYAFTPLDTRVEVAGLGEVEGTHAYRTVHGVYGYAGEPVALARVAAENRRFAAREQHEVLDELWRALGEGDSLHAFIQRAVAEEVHRAALVERMRERAIRHAD